MGSTPKIHSNIQNVNPGQENWVQNVCPCILLWVLSWSIWSRFSMMRSFWAQRLEREKGKGTGVLLLLCSLRANNSSELFSLSILISRILLLIPIGLLDSIRLWIAVSSIRREKSYKTSPKGDFWVSRRICSDPWPFFNPTILGGSFVSCIPLIRVKWGVTIEPK